MNRDCFWLTEDQFTRLEPLLPADTRGKPRVDDRRVISGIVHVLKSGGRWVDATPSYGPCKTLYNRFVRWAAAEISRLSANRLSAPFGAQLIGPPSIPHVRSLWLEPSRRQRRPVSTRSRAPASAT